MNESDFDFNTDAFLNKPKPFQMPQIGNSSPSILSGNSVVNTDTLFDPKSFAFNADALQLGGGAQNAPDSLLNPKDGAFSNYVIPGLDTLSGLTQAYTGYKALGLAEDQFNLGRDQYNANRANQGKVYNTKLLGDYEGALKSTAQYENDPQALEAQLAAYAKANTVSTAPIGG
jgi:hypothetical protein